MFCFYYCIAKNISHLHCKYLYRVQLIEFHSINLKNMQNFWNLTHQFAGWLSQQNPCWTTKIKQETHLSVR
jgi:hypothetical protein